MAATAPTLAQLIAACPPEVRRHIERIETMTDPAGLVAAYEAQRENAEALAVRVREIEAELAKR